MSKKAAILGMVAALLVGVAVTVWAQATLVTVSVKYENSTSLPALGNVTLWVYTWHTVADSKGITYGDCDAACRRLIVGEKMREQFNAWLYAQIANRNNSTANATTAAQVEALQGVVD